MTIMYLLLRRLLWHKISARVLYLLAKSAILYYLIPLPFLKRWYKEAIQAFLWKNQMEAAHISLAWTNYAVHVEGGLHVNIYARIQVLLVLVWLAGASFRIAKQVSEYTRLTRRFAVCAERIMSDRHRELISEFRERFGVKRNVTLYQGLEGESAESFGITKPVITCDREPGSREAELLISHEMVHIKRMDVLWSILLDFASFLHWWNLFMVKLYRDFERISECSCDETVMAGKSKEEIDEYLRILIKEALGKKELPIRWKNGFGENAEKIKERMENLKMNKKWNRITAGLLVAALTFANSMTVFAYRDVLHVEVAEDASQDEIEYTTDGDIYVFAPDDASEEEIQEFETLEELEGLMDICYDCQFMDEEGNVYPIAEDDGVEPYCDHNYVSGTSSIHKKYSDGSCEVRRYQAQRCSKCGYILQGDWIGTSTYAVCPH